MDFSNALHVLFALVVAHNLADFPLQWEFLSRAKNHRTDLGFLYWHWCLPAHALIHGGFVFAITGSLILGLLETVTHAFIDWLKCNEDISFTQDQIAHYVCKVIWVWLWFLCFKELGW
jgi:hypothetical protein